METKELTRRELLKKFGMAGAVLAAMPAAKAVGMEGEHKFKWPSGEEHVAVDAEFKWPDDNDFYETTYFLVSKEIDMEVKTMGRFNPKMDEFYFALPSRCIETLKRAVSIRGESAYDFMVRLFPKCQIVDSGEIDVVYKDGMYHYGHLPEGKGAVIARNMYGDLATMDKGFVYFDV